MSDVTRILSQIEEGDGKAAAQLLPLVYDELRKLAAQKMAQEAPGQTLQATALVHEAYLRLVDVEKVQHWDSRGHFFAAAADLREGAGLDGVSNFRRRSRLVRRRGNFSGDRAVEGHRGKANGNRWATGNPLAVRGRQFCRRMDEVRV